MKTQVFAPYIEKEHEEVSPSPSPASLGLNSQPYKNAHEKYAYEQQISNRIRPYLFLHAEDLTAEIDEAVCLTPEEYLDRFQGSWADHIQVCYSIATFFTPRQHTSHALWSPAEWQMVRSLAIDAFDTDTKKNVYSMGVKRIVESSSSELAEHYGWSADELLLCLTPSMPPFHVRYRGDHADLYLKRLVGNVDEVQEGMVANLYHHGDKDLMWLRTENMGFGKMGPDAIEKFLRQIKALSEEQRKRKQEFLKAYPLATAIDSLLEFDNWHEYVFVYSQVAYPDIHLREEVVSQATRLGLIEPDREPLSLSKEEIVELIERAGSQTERTFEMPVVNYKQTTTSCGVCCVMTLAGNEILPHNKTTEHKLWQQAGAPYNFPGGLGCILADIGYEVTYFLDRDQHFYPGVYPVVDIDTNYETSRIAELYITLHDQAIEKGMKCKKESVHFSDIYENLKQGKFCIIGIHIAGAPNILHWVLAYGYTIGEDGVKLKIADPLNEMSIMTEKTYERLVDTYMGRRVLVVDKNKTGART
jgi:hypothetical protein